MIQPIDDRILVLPDEVRDDVTAAGILVKVKSTVESQKQLGNTGVIVAIGPGKKGRDGNRIPLCVEAGQRIAFGEFQHKECHWEGKRYLIIQEADVCGVFE